MNSSRLPGKAMMPLGGMSLIERVIKRAQCSGYRVLLGTTNRTDDDVLEDVADQLGIGCFRGDSANVLKRAADAALKFDLSYFARLCGDRPLFSIQEIKTSLDLAQKFLNCENGFKPDLITNNFFGKKIKGLTTEVIRTDASLAVLDQTKNESHLEHLTSYFYQFPDKFNILSLKNINPYIPNCAGYAIDELDDYLRMNSLFNINSSIDLTIELADKLILDFPT